MGTISFLAIAIIAYAVPECNIRKSGFYDISMNEVRKVDIRDSVKTVTSNNFISAKGLETLSLKARKMLYIAISQCRMTDETFFVYSISAKEFAEIMEISPQAVYAEAVDTPHS